jgi:hypothetical protein
MSHLLFFVAAIAASLFWRPRASRRRPAPRGAAPSNSSSRPA